MDPSIPDPKFASGDRWVQRLLYHLHQCPGHHIPGGGGSIDVDLVVDPDLGDCDNLELLAQLSVLVTSVDENCQLITETCEGICEPDRLGTERSVRGGEDADPDFLTQFGYVGFHFRRQIHQVAGCSKDTFEEGACFLALGITVVS